LAAFTIVPAVSMMSSCRIRPAADVADHVHHFRRAVFRTAFVDDRQLGVEPLRVGAARSAPPASGETIVRFGLSSRDSTR
jgi:hypothetical protein